MPFYHHIHCQYTGIKGILTVYNQYLKYKYMISEKTHCERFNRTLQDEFIDFHKVDLLNLDIFNNKIIDYLIGYNTKRAHHAFHNKLSLIQFIMSLPANHFNLPQECKMRWSYTTVR